MPAKRYEVMLGLTTASISDLVAGQETTVD